MIDIQDIRIWSYFHPCVMKDRVKLPINSIIHKVGSISKLGIVEVIEHDLVDKLTYHVSEIDPVKLTDDILDQFHFRFIDNNKCWQFGAMRIYKLTDDVSSKFRLTLSGNELFNIKYVHELQNIYHCFLKEDLFLSTDIFNKLCEDK